MKKINEREYALKILEEIEGNGRFLKDVLEDFFYVYEFEKRERAFITKIVYGVIEHKDLLDYYIEQVSKTKIRKMKLTVRLLLELTVYQMLFMDKVPNGAAINEAVKIIKKRKMFQLSGFVNGVLRSVDREKENIEKSIMQLEKIQKLHIMYSASKEVIEYLLEEYSYEEIEHFLQESNKYKPTPIRCNPHKIEKEALKNELKKDCPMIHIEDGHVVDYSLYIDGYDTLEELSCFKKGLFQVQDESSMLVGELSGAKQGDVIIDLCAAPGGKSTHIAEKIGDNGNVIACDIYEEKLEKIKDNANRLGLKSIKTVQNDGTVLRSEWENIADIVLIDVPCSGLGIIRTKPDIKRNMTVQKMKELIPLQREIMETACRYVKKGGTFIYSTCTINKKENEQQIRWFTEKYSDFEVREEKVLMTEEKGTDGFYIAKMQRKKE